MEQSELVIIILQILRKMRPKIKEFANTLLDIADINGPEYQKSYDHLLWVIATSSIKDLREFLDIAFEDKYLNIPPPIQIAFFRIVLPHVIDDETRKDAILKGIAMYCDPVEADDILINYSFG